VVQWGEALSRRTITSAARRTCRKVCWTSCTQALDVLLARPRAAQLLVSGSHRPRSLGLPLAQRSCAGSFATRLSQQLRVVHERCVGRRLRGSARTRILWEARHRSFSRGPYPTASERRAGFPAVQLTSAPYVLSPLALRRRILLAERLMPTGNNMTIGRSGRRRNRPSSCSGCRPSPARSRPLGRESGFSRRSAYRAHELSRLSITRGSSSSTG